jgi:hypothetical protein
MYNVQTDLVQTDQNKRKKLMQTYLKGGTVQYNVQTDLVQTDQKRG